MTKIKDLVTVTVDNVFRLFPIDSERYELVDCVREMHDVFFAKDVLRVPVTIEDDRIKMFLSQTVQNFALGACSLLRVQAALPSDRIPDIVRDRARRVAASISTWDVGLDPEKDARENVETWIWCLWANLHRVLQDMHTVHGVPKDMELLS